MKKYLLLICLIVTPVLAENAGELTVTGYPPPKTDYSSLASEGAYAASKAAAASTGNLQATSFSNLAYAQMKAAQTAGCIAGVKEWYRLEVTDARDRYSATSRDCFSTFSSPELLASREACLDQAQGHYRGAVDSSQDNKDIRLENCSKYP